MVGRRREHRVRPLRHGRDLCPEAVERVLHERTIEGHALVGDDALEVELRALRRVVRSLAGDRVVDDDDIGDAEHRFARGQRRDRVTHRGREASGEGAPLVGELDVFRARVLPGDEALHQVEREREVRLGVGDAVEDVERAARDRLEEDRVAWAGRREAWDDEELADAGDQIASHGEEVVLGALVETTHVRHGERALRRDERRARRVAFEHLHELALTRGDEHEIVRGRALIERRDRGFFEHDLTPARLEERQEPRHLHALVDRLRGPRQVADPIDRSAAIGCGDRHAEPVDAGRLISPKVELEVTLVRERIAEHALRGEHTAFSDRVRRSIGDQSSLVTARL